MSSKQSILRAHYTALARRIASWAGVVALVGSVLVPMGAQATTGQLEPRSTSVGTSSPAVGASTTYTFSFTPSSTNSGATIKAIGFQLCSGPLDGTACNAVSSSSMSSATFAIAGQAAPFNANWAQGTGSDCGAPSATYICIFYTTGTSLLHSTNYNVIIKNVQNPELANTTYYTRITTYTAYAAGTPSGETDFGGESLSTGTSLTVAANVQESLTFSVGSGASCIAGTTVNVGTTANNVLTTGTMSGAVSQECVSTNALNGYNLYYLSSSATSPATCPNGGTAGAFTNCVGSTHDFGDCTVLAQCGTPANTTFTYGVGHSADADYFGINLAADTSATSGDQPVTNSAVPTGGIAVTVAAPYATAHQYAFTHNAVTLLANPTVQGPTATTTFTTTYGAEAGNLTPAGQYAVNMDYICTASY